MEYMKISANDVRYLAELSSLELAESEVDALRVDLDNIVSYIEQLGELDTSGIQPTYQVVDLENVYRDDEIIDYGLKRDQLINLASSHTEDSIKVPKVL